MAITSITISQDNKSAGSNLCPIHSPLIFIATATYTGDAPNNLGVKLAIEDLSPDPEPFATYTAIYYDDPTATTRRFVFVANDAIKAAMPALAENYQLNETLTNQDFTALLRLRFYDIDAPGTDDDVTIDFIHAARQFTEVPNCTDIYSNADRTYYAKKGSHVYIYFYDNNDDTDVAIVDNGVSKGNFTFDGVNITGLYRYKTNVTGNKTVTFTNINGTSTATIIAIDDCDDGAELKYLDRNGMFRFFPFNKFYEITDAPELIGEIQNFLTSIETNGGASRPVGYSTKRIYNLTASNVDAEQLEILSEVYSSPAVYLRVGTGDTPSDWLRVRVTGSDALLKRRKYVGGRVDFVVEVPEIYNISNFGLATSFGRYYVRS